MPKASGRLSLCTLMSRAERRLSQKVSRLFKVDFHRLIASPNAEWDTNPFHTCTDFLRIFVEVTGDSPCAPTRTSTWSSVSQYSFHVAGRAKEESSLTSVKCLHLNCVQGTAVGIYWCSSNHQLLARLILVQTTCTHAPPSTGSCCYVRSTQMWLGQKLTANS